MTTQRRHYTGKDGRERVYETHLLRRSWREDGKVRNETVANLSRLPAETLELVRRSLAGERFIPAGAGAAVTRSLPHGHAAAVAAMARKLGFPALLGPPGPQRDLAYALIISRVIRPASKLSTARWWDDVTLGPDLGVAGASADEVYEAMDWLASRQDDIEKQLAARHLREGGIAMFDLSSSWVEGTHCELAAFGYSRDGKRGKAQIEYGLLTSRDGRPVAVRVFAGNTADPKAFPEAVQAVRGTFGMEQMIMVGDRGMITTARIKDLREMEGMTWITCLRHPAIKKLMASGGPLQLSLFDEQDLAEITSPDFPGERLVACRNPFEAAKRARTREALLAATEKDLGKVAAQAAAGRIRIRARSACARAGSSTGGRWPSISSWTSARAACPGAATRTTSTPRRPPTGSTSSAPPSPKRPSTPRARWPPTRTWPAWNATSGTSKPTTWTCGPSGTASKTASKPTS